MQHLVHPGWEAHPDPPFFFFSFMATKGGQLVAGSGVEAGTTPSSPPFYSLIVFSQRNKSQKGDGSDNLGIR